MPDVQTPFKQRLYWPTALPLQPLSAFCLFCHLPLFNPRSWCTSYGPLIYTFMKEDIILIYTGYWSIAMPIAVAVFFTVRFFCYVGTIRKKPTGLYNRYGWYGRGQVARACSTVHKNLMLRHNRIQTVVAVCIFLGISCLAALLFSVRYQLVFFCHGIFWAPTN